MDVSLITDKQGGEGIIDGQNYYYSRGGQHIGSIWGHGSYLAPDWAAGTNRPDREVTYTLNWPYDPLVGNKAVPEAIIWSIVSRMTVWIRFIPDIIFAADALLMLAFVARGILAVLL